MRLGETYLLAAEAAGRMGDFAKAVDYINMIRKRAAWADGERKNLQIYEIEGGTNDTKDTYERMQVTPAGSISEEQNEGYY